MKVFLVEEAVAGLLRQILINLRSWPFRSAPVA